MFNYYRVKNYRRPKWQEALTDTDLLDDTCEDILDDTIFNMISQEIMGEIIGEGCISRIADAELIKRDLTRRFGEKILWDTTLKMIINEIVKPSIELSET